MSMQWRRRTILTAIVMLLLGTGLPATILADGGGGGDERANLPRGKPEDPDYAAGVRAIKANRFAEAIPMLQRVVERDSQNADAYNWLAYATRRNGDAAAALPLYEKALAINPKHRGAHEYMGEAYLVLGNLAKAKEHLARLDSLCMLGCSEYRDLKRAVEQYEKTGKVSATH
ncbi:MAG TPA: tetratricopeptide repeat protein [Methylomirabilota bacterium]|jgi:Flp pilus assembly protein TadD|nr:tetratricopeptide repeat protein [Methylomirabilota bacterium]